MLNNFDKKAKPFKVPENYFENLNKEIMVKIPDKKRVKIMPLWKKTLPWVAVAAASIGIIFYSGILNPTIESGNSTMPNTNLASTSDQLSSSISAKIDEDEFYEYIENETTESAYKDMFYNDYN